MRAKIRPEGYAEDVKSHGTIVGDFLEISNENYSKMVRKYSPVPIPTKGSCCGDNREIFKGRAYPNPPEFIRQAISQSSAMPPITEQARNALMAARRLANAAIRGEKVKASEEKVKERQAICDACEFKKDNRCQKCGCFWKVKIALETETCPINKW